MMKMAPSGILRNLDAWDPVSLREQLRKGGFHREALDALGLPANWLRPGSGGAALLGHAPDGSPVNTLLRLFTLGDSVSGDEALRTLGDAIHGLLEIGFLEAGGGVVRSLYQIQPVADGWLASDFPKRHEDDIPDFVMGIGLSSMLLASLAPPVTGRVLEVACGIGWLAGNLAKTGLPVVATDINPRALALARFSAKLCGVQGIDFRHGDGFSAVAGEEYDLIVSNPPYVQSPGGQMVYKESQPGDSICARLLRDVPGHLAPGGIALILINWTHATDDDWTAAPLSWVAADGTRRWLFQTECSSPADYAWKWISVDPRFQGEQAAKEEIRRWLTFYQQSGVKRISGGFMVIQKCLPGGEWTRTDSRALDKIDAIAGIEVRRILENQTWLVADHDLLETRFEVPDGVRAEARMNLGPDGWNRETIRLTSPARLCYDGQIDENILRLLAIVREGKTPAAMVAEILERPEFAAVPDIPERITELVRDLVSHGILIPS